MSVLLGLVGACTVPVMHPMRAHEGPGASLGVAAIVGAEDSGKCDNERGCYPAGAGGLGLFNIDGRWGTMLTGIVGLLGGLYFPGFRNSKNFEWHGMFMAYAQLSVQNEYLSVAVGPEVGTGAFGLTGGFDVQPWGEEELWYPNFAAYFRYIRPYFPETDVEANGRVPSWDSGVSVRMAFVHLQYSYFRQTEGVIDYVIYETSTRASAWHVVMVAIDIWSTALFYM